MNDHRLIGAEFRIKGSVSHAKMRLSPTWFSSELNSTTCRF